MSATIAACILAAGSSRRMGSPKAWLDADGQPFVVRLLESFRAAGVELRFVVGAMDDVAMRDACAARGARLLVNPTPEHGMLSSLHVCLDAIGDSKPPVDALFVCPVDCPRVRPETIVLLIEAFEAKRSPVVVPRFGARRGHPTLFDAALFDELRHAPLEVGARAVVRAHAADRLEVPVEDEAVLDDVDTRVDLQKLSSRSKA
jgi:molybdenum cofactor cytidylyltransferase